MFDGRSRGFFHFSVRLKIKDDCCNQPIKMNGNLMLPIPLTSEICRSELSLKADAAERSLQRVNKLHITSWPKENSELLEPREQFGRRRDVFSQSRSCEAWDVLSDTICRLHLPWLRC